MHNLGINNLKIIVPLIRKKHILWTNPYDKTRTFYFAAIGNYKLHF